MVLSDRDEIELISVDDGGMGSISGASKGVFSVDGRAAADVADLVEFVGERMLPATGPTGVSSRVMFLSPPKSKEKPLFSGRLLVSKLFAARVGGGDGVSRPFSLIGPRGGVLGNIGSAHSKCGVERPENIAELRRTLRPRGKENFPYVYEEAGPDT